MNVLVKKQVGYQAMRKRLKAKNRTIEVRYLHAFYFVLQIKKEKKKKLGECNTALPCSAYWRKT